MKYLVLVALFGAAVVESAKFTKCEESSDDICEVTDVQINSCTESPCTLRKRRESSIQFHFTPHFNANKLTSSLYWARAANDDIEFDQFSNVDVCPYTGCPTQASQSQEFAYSLLLSKKLPDGKYTFKWKLWDADNKSNMCCFKTNVQLRK